MTFLGNIGSCKWFNINSSAFYLVMDIVRKIVIITHFPPKMYIQILTFLWPPYQGLVGLFQLYSLLMHIYSRIKWTLPIDSFVNSILWFWYRCKSKPNSIHVKCLQKIHAIWVISSIITTTTVSYPSSNKSTIGISLECIIITQII
jgi:hypothetical protein